MRLLLCLLILSIGACAPTREKQSNSVIQISKELIENADSLYLSELCDKITYIPLETSDSSLIGKAPQFFITKTKILVSSHKCPLLVFDRETGKFLNHVGHKGDDPKGYSDDGWGNVSFWVDHNHETIYFPKDFDTLVKYDINGKYIGKVKLPKSIQTDLSGCYFYIQNDTILCHNKYICNENTPLLFAFGATTGDLYWKINQQKPLLPSYSEIESDEYLYGFIPKYGGNMRKFHFGNDRSYIYSPTASTIWHSNNALYFKESFIDTIYLVKDGFLVADKAISLGTNTWPYDLRYDNNASSDKLAVSYLLESKQFIYMYLVNDLYGKNSKPFLVIYDKVKQTTHINTNDRLINDVDNTLPIVIQGVTTDHQFYGTLLPADIIAFKQSQQYKLPEQLSSINSEEDNPVVVILE